MKKWIFLGVGALLLVGISVGATLFLSGALSPPPPPAADAPEAAAAIPEPPKINQEIIDRQREIFYHALQPEFLVTFSSRERPRNLMVEITVSSYNDKSFELLGIHEPELRNNLLLLMSQFTGSELGTVDGKNKLRDAVKAEVNELLRKYVGLETIEDVYFIRFVLQ